MPYTSVFKDCELTGPSGIAFYAEAGDEPAEVTIPNAGTGSPSAQHVFRGPSDEPLSLNDIWMSADDQIKIFDKVPKDNKDYFVKVMLTPSDNLQLCTSKGNRRVKIVTMPLRLRWKHEFISLSDAKVFRYKAAVTTDPLPEQILVEFETKQASSNNLRLGFQLQLGDAIMSASVEVVPAEPGAKPDPAEDGGSKTS